MAIKKTIDIDINTNADEAAKEFDKFGKAVNTADKSVTDLNKTFEEVYGEMQPLTTRMGEAEDRLYELAAAGDTASREYQGLLQKVGDYRKVQIQTDIAVDSAATTLGQKLGGALGGATAGFAAVQGVMGLVGGESEQLEKALLKVQSALAIQQGVQGIREAIPGFKMLGKTATNAFKGMTKASKGFALTGIGVVLTAVAALAYALNELEEAEKKAEEARQKRHDTVMKDYDDEIAKKRQVAKEVNSQLDIEQEAREQQVKLLQAQGKSITEADWEAAQGFMNNIQTKGKALKEEYLRLGKETQAAYVALHKEFRGSLNNTQEFKDREKAATKIVDAKKAANKKEQAALLAQMQELAKIRDSQFDNMEVLEAQHLKNRQDAYKKFQDERLKMFELIQDLENQILEDGVEKEVEISNVRFERLIAGVKGTGEEKKRLTELYLYQQQEAENQIRNKFRQDQLNVEKEFQVETMMPLMEELGQKEINIKRMVADVVVGIDIDKSKKQIAAMEAVAATEKAIQDAKFANASAGIALVQSLAGENKKLQAAAIVAESAVGIAKIIIATQTSNAATTAQGAALAIPSAGASVAAATALVLQNNIAAGISIGATVAAAGQGLSALGTGGSVEGGDVPSGGGVGGGSVPNFNVVGDSGVNQLATLQQQPTQAYVVSGEVTTAQALDRNRVQNATL